MSLAVYSLVVRLFLVTSLLVPGVQNLLQGEQFEQVQNAYEQTLDEREKLVDELREREAEYRALLEQVDLLKGSPNTLQNRMELERLLRQSRELAGQMEPLQKKIRATDRRLANQRDQLVETLDAAMTKIEERLAQSSASERRAMVAQLNELRSTRQQYTSPLPSAPTDGQVDEALAMLGELDSASADDLLAAADELEDTEDQVRQRLQAIDERITQLRSAKQLARRARTFSSEGSFFDETSRSRFIARQNTGGDAVAGSGDESARQGTANNDTSNSANNVIGEEDGMAGEPVADEGIDGADDGDMEAGAGSDPGLSDQPGQPEAAPEAEDDASSGDDVFGSGDGDIFIDSDADPEASRRSGFGSDDELEGRIRRLEEEQKRLEEQAGELEQKAGQLRKRAHDSVD